MEEGKKRITIISICSLILVAMVVAVTIGVSQNTDSQSYNHHDITTSGKAIKNICEPTDYKEVCVQSLTTAAGNTSDPKELIKVAFQVAMEQMQQAVQNSTLLQELQTDPRTKDAVGDCQDLANSALNDLKRSIGKMGEVDASSIDELLANLKTWLSGAITYQETCLDGFENTTGDAGEKMKEYLKIGMQLTSNALAMVTEISSTLQSLDIQGYSRRLLWEDIPVMGHGSEFPSWVDSGSRKLLTAAPAKIKPDLVVAKDGSGKYRTINEALGDIPENSNKTFVLYIKEGVYDERVQFNRTLTNLMVVGDGATKTRITGSLNFIDGTSTFKTATVVVLGDFFMAKDIGFENSAGPEKHQAVALRVGADMVVFYNCQMDGYQDTLYAHTYRQFYRDCVISGTIDFVFGNSASIFQNCTFVVRKPLSNQANIVTAQGRTSMRQPTGIVLQNCTIVADPAYYPVRKVIKSYIGRPWKDFSRTVVMESFLDDLIDPDGWLPWNGTYGIDTCFYTEYNNRGPGSSTLKRLQWKGVKQVKKTVIDHFTAEKFVLANSWIPATGVPYSPGLIYPPPVDSPRATSDSGDKDSADPYSRQKSDYIIPKTTTTDVPNSLPMVPTPAASPAISPVSQVTTPPPRTPTPKPGVSPVSQGTALPLPPPPTPAPTPAPASSVSQTVATPASTPASSPPAPSQTAAPTPTPAAETQPYSIFTFTL